MGKTGTEIFEMASALIYEGTEDDKESRAFTKAFLNIHLQECLAAENSIRRSLGETELSEAPWITDLTKTIDYHDAITRSVLPYACASHYYFEAMNETRGFEMKNEYKERLDQAAVCTEIDIVDAYATEA